MEEIINDIEGNSYNTVKIGNQIWMAENLRVSLFSNGESIDYVTDSIQWQNSNTPCQTTYENKRENIKLGRLYNWFSVNAIDGICPQGWRIPNLQDWMILSNNYGGFPSAGIALQQRNQFNAELHGYRTGNFEGLGQTVYYWTIDSDENQPELPPPGRTSKAISIRNNETNVILTNEYQIEGFYIRCIKI